MERHRTNDAIHLEWRYFFTFSKLLRYTELNIMSLFSFDQYSQLFYFDEDLWQIKYSRFDYISIWEKLYF